MKSNLSFPLIVLLFCSLFQTLAAQNNGLITFYAKVKTSEVHSADRIVEIVNGNKVGDTLFAVSKKKLTLAKKPGVYAFTLFNAFLDSIPVKANCTTYVGIYAIFIQNIMQYNIVVSGGSTPIPNHPEIPGDMQTLKTALDDGDWATREFAIGAFSTMKGEIEGPVIEKIKDMAVNDRFKPVCEEAIDFLKKRKISVPPELFFVTNFTEMEGGWSYKDESGKWPHYGVDGQGYHVVDTSFTYSAVWLKDLLVRKGFSGFNPKKLKNYDVELDCRLVTGPGNAGYGLILGKNADPTYIERSSGFPAILDIYYGFCIAMNGYATVFQVVNNQFAKNPVDWSSSASRSIVSQKANRIKVEVRGKEISYYVNGMMIGSFDAADSFEPEGIGMVITNNMHACFSRLGIQKYD
jgi:hypothetical protein